ncbi:MAG: DnaJ family domain-containing protein [Acidimicrobiales bacterium]
MERKPAGMTWESWIDRQIREAQERGEFDGLSTAGKPIADLDRRRGDDWWTKQLVRREGVDTLPKTLQVRKELEQTLLDIAEADDPETVRALVGRINARILEINRMAASGPPSNLMPLDVERVLTTWASGRGEAAAADD